jgi:hypothetical protein
MKRMKDRKRKGGKKDRREEGKKEENKGKKIEIKE